MESGNKILGLLAIILGVLVIVFPFLGLFTISILMGLSILFLGIYLLFLCGSTWGENKGISILFLILALAAIIVGIAIIGNIAALSFLAGLWFYLGGFFLLIIGILGLFSRDHIISRGSSFLVILTGIVYIILGFFAFNPLFLAIIIGIGLIFDGIALLFVNPTEMIEKI